MKIIRAKLEFQRCWKKYEGKKRKFPLFATK
jgi:hypothetical protein